MRFEGDEVLRMEAVLPRITVDCDDAYRKDTRLTLEVSVRVKQVRFEDNRDGGVKRVHVFEIENLVVMPGNDPEPSHVDTTVTQNGHVVDSATGDVIGRIGETQA